jgi:succinate dehydrogenase / fumarate reductase membrane anchor subunit
MPYPDPNKIQTPIARAKGDGSAHSGAHHWLLVKITAVALIPLTLWFFFSLLCLIAKGATYDMSLAWVKLPYNAFLLAVFLAVNFYHAGIAGQEIIVDYVPKAKFQIPAVTLYKFFCYGVAMLSVFSVLYITFKL